MPQFDPLIFFSLMYYVLISCMFLYSILLRWSFYNFVTSLKYKEKIISFFFRSTQKNWDLILNIFRFKYKR